MIQYFIHAIALPDHRFEILDRKAAPLHLEFDGFDWVRQLHLVLLEFVGINERGEYIQSFTLRGIEFGIHQ